MLYSLVFIKTKRTCRRQVELVLYYIYWNVKISRRCVANNTPTPWVTEHVELHWGTLLVTVLDLANKRPPSKGMCCLSHSLTTTTRLFQSPWWLVHYMEFLHFLCVCMWGGGRGAGSPHPSHTNTMLIHNRNTGSPPRWQPHLYWMVTKTSHSRSSRLKGNTIQSLKALKL